MISTHVLAVERSFLAAEACLEPEDFKAFLREIEEATKRWLESTRVDNGLGFFQFQDEE